MTAIRRVLVADDEPLARERLRLLLSRHPKYEIVAECTDGDEALASIEAHREGIAAAANAVSVSLKRVHWPRPVATPSHPPAP